MVLCGRAGSGARVLGDGSLLNVQTIGLPLGARTLVFALHLCVGGIVVGAMFPIALRRSGTSA